MIRIVGLVFATLHRMERHARRRAPR